VTAPSQNDLSGPSGVPLETDHRALWV